MIKKTDIEQAYENIRSSIVEAPMRRSHIFSDLCGCDILLEIESLQMSRAFKEHGALNRLLQLTDTKQQRAP